MTQRLCGDLVKDQSRRDARKCGEIRWQNATKRETVLDLPPAASLLDHRAINRDHGVNPMHRPKMIDIFIGEQFWALKPRLKLVMTDSHFAPAALGP